MRSPWTAGLGGLALVAACNVPTPEIGDLGRPCDGNADCVASLACIDGHCQELPTTSVAASSGTSSARTAGSTSVASSGAGTSGRASASTGARATTGTSSAAASSAASSAGASGTSRGASGASTSAGASSGSSTAGSSAGTSSGGSTSTGGAPTLTYYISPTGSDSNDGLSSSAPWQTFAHALPQLNPGNALVLLDGVYAPDNSGTLQANCQEGDSNGIAGLPITITAAHERAAEIPSATSPPISIYYCADWVFDGLFLFGGDDSSQTGSVLVDATDDDSLTFHRMLFQHPNPYAQYAAALTLNNSTNCLLEENEFYDFAYEAVLIYQAQDNVVRRNYFNSDGMIPPGGTQVSAGVQFGDGVGNLVENCVIENVGAGFLEQPTSQTGPSDNTMLGDIVLDSYTGFYLQSSCGSPCAPVEGDVLMNDVALNTVTGFLLLDGMNVTFENDTVHGSSYNGFQFLPNGASFTTTFTALDDVASNAGIGFDDGYGTTFSYCDAFSDDPGFSSSSDGTDVSLPIGSNQCVVYLPPGSPIAAVGVDGGPMGASVVDEYENGVLTSTPLWDPSTGAFPCGAIVAGVNDADGGNCATVNLRVGVGTPTCPVP